MKTRSANTMMIRLLSRGKDTSRRKVNAINPGLDFMAFRLRDSCWLAAGQSTQTCAACVSNSTMSGAAA
jgi:hypothetical protein